MEAARLLTAILAGDFKLLRHLVGGLSITFLSLHLKLKLDARFSFSSFDFLLLH